MPVKFPEFKLKNHQFWIEDEVPSGPDEVKQFFQRGYDVDLLKRTKEKDDEVYRDYVEELIADYNTMLENPSRYWP